MTHPTHSRVAAGHKMRAIGVLLTALLVMALSAASVGAATSPGKAFAWGYDGEGQLGNGAAGPNTNVPGAVSNPSGVKSVKAGCEHGLALKENGTVWAWGLGNHGQLGTGTDDSEYVPTKVRIDAVKAISAGCDHNLVLKENGTVWAWGDGQYGQLGNGNLGPGQYSNVPVKVADIGAGAKGIAAGNDFGLALMKNGTVRSWGYNGSGQLGNGTDTPRSEPGSVSNLSNVRAIATDSSAAHVLALLESGRVKSWGDDEEGQLGNGIEGNEDYKPVAVVNLTGVRAIAAGDAHSLALLGSGGVKSWGDNYYGQLGNGNAGPGFERSAPGAVSGLTGVRSISGGREHSLAVLESGKVRSWGHNEFGQLGNGASGPGAHSSLPVGVKNLTNVRNVDGGDHFTLATTH